METRIEATKAQHKIYRGFFLQLPNHTALRVSSRLRINYLVKFIGKRHDVKLQKSNLKTFSQAELKEYEKSYKSAKLWHGSGKYKYDINGEIVDVFANVLSSSSLNPARDVYAVIGGLDETHTISTTKLRIIARSYADTFGKGLEEKNRYGAASFWVTYHYSTFYAMLFSRYAVKTFRNWSKWRKKATNDDKSTAWGQKVNSQSEHVWDTFDLGSDISGNFPIIYGISRLRGGAVEIPKSFEKYEVRLGQPVKVSDLCHIEVPADRVAEVKRQLSRAGYDGAKVFAIELGEYYASMRDFHELVGL